MKINIKKIINKNYKEYDDLKKEFGKKKIKIPIKQLFGKYQYIYSSKKGNISLIQLKNYNFITNKDVWEIYEQSNNELFTDVERYNTKQEAEKRIRGLLR